MNFGNKIFLGGRNWTIGSGACSVAGYGIKSFKLPVSLTTTSATTDKLSVQCFL